MKLVAEPVHFRQSYDERPPAIPATAFRICPARGCKRLHLPFLDHTAEYASNALTIIFPSPLEGEGAGGECGSVRNAVLMQLLVQGGDGFVEGALQEGQMVVLAVMVRNRAGTPLRRPADVLEAAIQQGEHVVGGVRAEQIVVAAAGQV